MMKITVDKVKGVLKTIKSLKNDRVLVGIPQEENHRNDAEMTNATLGYIHENGSPARNIPARPFLVKGVEKVQDKAADMLAQSAKDALSDKDTKATLVKVGIMASSSVKNTLQAGEGFEPLSERTIAERKRRGFKGTKPLIRTGQLRNSITFVVRDH